MKIVLKTIVIWFVMVVAAIVNGVIRDKLITPILGLNISLPLSGVMLSLAVLLIVYFSIPFFGNRVKLTFLLIGIGLVSMTLAFELLFGHYMLGKPWETILQVFNIIEGDLFIVVLCVSLLSPYLVAKFRGFIQS